MQHWVEDGATQFREYITEHPEELPNASDSEAMKALLQRIRARH